MCQHCSEPFVHQPDWHRRKPFGERPGERPAVGGRGSLAAGQPDREANNDLHGVVVRGQLSHGRKIARTSPHGVERRGEQTTGIRASDADAH